MTWNYRVVKHIDENEVGGITSGFFIHEVCYDNDGGIKMRSENPMFPSGETMEEFLDDLECMKRSVFKPVLVLDKINCGSKTSCGFAKLMEEKK